MRMTRYMRENQRVDGGSRVNPRRAEPRRRGVLAKAHPSAVLAALSVLSAYAAEINCWNISNQPCVTAGASCYIVQNGSTYHGTINNDGPSWATCVGGSPGGTSCTMSGNPTQTCTFTCEVFIGGQWTPISRSEVFGYPVLSGNC
jgi:hypothetical protein